MTVLLLVVLLLMVFINNNAYCLNTNVNVMNNYYNILHRNKHQYNYRFNSFSIYSQMDSNNQINKDISKDKDKVVDTLTIGKNEKLVLCRCWRSSKFPLCDGAHAKHNKETNDNIGPCIISSNE